MAYVSGCEVLAGRGDVSDGLVHVTLARQAVHTVIQRVRHSLRNLQNNKHETFIQRVRHSLRNLQNNKQETFIQRVRHSLRNLQNNKHDTVVTTINARWEL